MTMDEDDRRGPQESFSIMRESKGIAASRVLCCPTMDIVAILTTDHHVVVYQSIEWKKLLHVQPSDVHSEVTQLAWRPNGRTLAVGHRDGRILLHDVETASQLIDSGTERLASPIVSLCWINLDGCEESKIRDRTAFFVMNPPVVSSETQSSMYTRIQPVSGEHHILVSADERGTIRFWFHGVVCLLQLDSSLQAIRQVTLKEDLSCLLVALDTKLITYQLPQVKSCKEELVMLAHHMHEIHNLCSTFDSALKQTRTEWSNGVKVFEAKVRLLPGEYAKYGCKDVPQMHIHALLCSGICFPALGIFLSQYLQEQSLRKMQQAFSHSCQTVEMLLHEQLSTATTNILFRLSELRGLAKFHANLHAFGFNIDALSAVITSVEKIFRLIAATQSALQDTSMDFGLFLTWLGEMNAHLTSKTVATTRSSIDTLRLARFLNRATEVAVAYQQTHSPADMEVTFGSRVPELIESLLRERAELQQRWNVFIKHMSTPTTLPSVDRWTFPEPKSIFLDAQWGLFWRGNSLIVLDTNTWMVCRLSLKSTRVIDACMYIRGSTASVAVLLHSDDANGASLQLLPIETPMLQPMNQLHDLDSSDIVIRSRRLSPPPFSSLAANGTRGVLCVLSQHNGTFTMFDGECDEEEEEDASD
ncbi:hypothetical protein Ae201684_003707 [Aphanomyces euteiches]|uniref:Anaphase-promoting complex subunit 4 n=1 Tax=Aphanomyces euteiches TaxID=100861 RepID=A0A6G0XLB1_9STRA|nr:hypothetical protein Ae201684_003707 [Aphanomyces euteiches]KAH9145065.1 hypothetical protein AeRB84_011023 [Aphanomyces euteiches]